MLEEKIKALVAEMKALYNHAVEEFKRCLAGIGDKKLVRDTLNHLHKASEKLMAMIAKLKSRFKEELTKHVTAMHTHIANAKSHFKQSHLHKSYKEFLNFGAFLGTIEAIVFAFMFMGI